MFKLHTRRRIIEGTKWHDGTCEESRYLAPLDPSIDRAHTTFFSSLICILTYSVARHSSACAFPVSAFWSAKYLCILKKLGARERKKTREIWATGAKKMWAPDSKKKTGGERVSWIEKKFEENVVKK